MSPQQIKIDRTLNPGTLEGEKFFGLVNVDRKTPLITWTGEGYLGFNFKDYKDPEELKNYLINNELVYEGFVMDRNEEVSIQGKVFVTDFTILSRRDCFFTKVIFVGKEEPTYV